MSREIDFDKKLSKDDEQYLLDRGNPAELRRAGLMDPVDFDLSSTPGSLPEHVLAGEPEPAFDLDSKAAEVAQEESVGQEQVLLPTPGPSAETEQVPFKADKAPTKGGSTSKASDTAPKA